MTTYPETLPAPQIADYQVDVGFGLSSIQFERGNTRQRKLVRNERHVFTLSYVLDPSLLWQWQTWVNRYGYDWHYQNLTSSYSGFTSDITIPHYVRLISDISLTPIDARHVRVTVLAEMEVATLPVGAVVPSGDWIVAGTPASPSNSNSYQAGTPASPWSSNTVIAGSPGQPAA